jgi:ketosteroid isomerase-like protein
MIRALTLAGALAVIMACESPEASGAVPVVAGADPAAEVVDASKAIITAFGRNDPDAYFKLFDPEATFIFYTTPQRLESCSAYEQEWAAWRRNLGFRVRSCTSSDQRVQLFGDVAILTHLVRTEITTKNGDETLHERETIVFHVARAAGLPFMSISPPDHRGWRRAVAGSWRA